MNKRRINNLDSKLKVKVVHLLYKVKRVYRQTRENLNVLFAGRHLCRRDTKTSNKLKLLQSSGKRKNNTMREKMVIKVPKPRG